MIFPVHCEEVRQNLKYIDLKLAHSVVLYRDDVLFINGCDKLLNYSLFESVYFVENSEVLVADSFKFVRCNTCGIVCY